MKFGPKGFGGDRTPPEKIKREGWRTQGVLVISEDDRHPAPVARGAGAHRPIGLAADHPRVP